MSLENQLGHFIYWRVSVCMPQLYSAVNFTDMKETI